ncbi:shikimate dehydrogenase [Synechococcus sp. CCY 9618]|uniref:shikimate dehydrogenase n=1 Tax=Synechococcus sp. CCY 9618 TaxID=2815602 RepID=UPI001C22F322|nr:shikimate dehydrogenase [Synechococcus sp. CCY 9618]
MATPPTATAIGGGTALAGVLGDPVRHSLSPAMHNAAIAALGLDWAYLALPVKAADLAGVLLALEALDCRGLNVTLPHKQAAAELAGELTPLARRLGAVNTLVRREGGGWLGTNTDVEGFLAPLRPAGAVGHKGRPWSAREALVLGCGGSARAVVAGLVELGLGRIRVAGRNRTTLAHFLDICTAWAPGLEPLPWGQEPVAEPGPLAAALARTDLVVNTTPVGMASGSDPGAASRSPLRPDQLAALPPGATVYDLIYTPRPTALLRLARERGCTAIDGLEMLVQQGAAALRLWSGRRDVPVAAMRVAALARLEGH